MSDQRRTSWPWRKLKLSSLSPSKSRADKSLPSTQRLPLTTSSFKADELVTRAFSNRWKQATCSSVMEDGRVREAIALREQAEENLKALKQELGTLVKELTAKETLVKQHQKVADEAVSGWEKSEKEVLSLKQELDAASQRKVILEDRIAHLDAALKECTRQFRHVRDEQERRIQEIITSKTRELEEVKADMEAKQAELERRLMESDARSSAMAKSLQERAWKILEANEAKSKVEAELNIMQVKLGSAEKDISSLQYELHLLSKELEIRNEEVVFCKKSADAAHKQHLDNVHKLAKVEADCQRLRILLKKKLPGPAAIAQMRKEVEGLSTNDDTTAKSVTAEFKRRPSRSYASTTISFANSHQNGIGTNKNRSNPEMLRDRFMSMEEENKLLKEALSKRMGELQTSRLLCAKTVNKLSIAEDYLESLQGTPRDPGKTSRSFDFDFATTETRSAASLSDVEEASCAESWASALIGELAHFKREKTITKEAIMEVTEPSKIRESSNYEAHGVDVKHVVQHEEKYPCVNGTLSEARIELPLEMGCALQCQMTAVSLLCKELKHKLDIIQEAIMAGNYSESFELIELVDAAQKTFSALDKEIQELKSHHVQLPVTPEDGNVRNMADTVTITTSEMDNTGLHAGMPGVPTTTTETAVSTATFEAKELVSAQTKAMNCQGDESKLEINYHLSAVKSCEGNEEEKHEGKCSSRIGSMLVSLANQDNMQEVRVNAVGCLPHEQRDDDVADSGPSECNKPGEMADDVVLAGVNADVAAATESPKGLLLHVDRCDEVDADTATFCNERGRVNADMAALPDAHVDGHDDVDASAAARHDELDAHVAAANRLGIDLASKLARLQSDQERLCEERDKLICERGAMKDTDLLHEAQAQLSHYKRLHSQLQIKNEELQLKLQG